MLTLLGVLRLGTLIRHIPHAVTVGFTCGIAVTILASQLKDLGGLLPGAEPGPLLPKLAALGRLAHAQSGGAGGRPGLGRADFPACGAGAGWPGMLIAVVRRAGGLAAASAGRDHRQPFRRAAAWPAGAAFAGDLDASCWVLPAALSFTLLGGVESLLSAKVADGMTGRKHRSNMELVAQGVANIASALFGGIGVTGTIARTATNIRAGAQKARCRACCMRCSFCCSCWSRARWPASCRWRRWPACWWWCAGTWRRRTSSRACCALARRHGADRDLRPHADGDLTHGIIAGCALAAAFAIYDRIRARRING